MRERERYEFAMMTAEVMHTLLEDEYQRGERDPDKMMIRFKDLSAYSLTHVEIMDQREGPELLALAMFFGATSDPRFHKKQERIELLSEDAIAYQGLAEVIEQDVKMRKAKPSRRVTKNNDANPSQPRLF